MPTTPSPGLPLLDRGPWEPFVYWKVIHAAAVPGACVLANSRKEPILVAHGILRTVLWRLLNDPRAHAHDAYYFYVRPTGDADPRETAWALLRRLEAAGAKPAWEDFPAELGRAATKDPRAPSRPAGP